jgi:uncharacterized protein YcfL
MKDLKYFLFILLLAVGCQKEEEFIDWEMNAMSMEESAHIAGDPIPSPQEFLIKESPSIE